MNVENNENQNLENQNLENQNLENQNQKIIKQPRYIFHISDLHIIVNENRYVEYYEVFENLYQMMIKDPLALSDATKPILVITGDIFDEKIKYDGDKVRLFYKFLFKFKEFPMVIIPGNHDFDKNNKNKSDLIEPLLEYIGIPLTLKYSKKTEFFEFLGHKFLHLSQYDDNYDFILECEETKKQLPESIILFHGFADGATFGSSKIKRKLLPLNVINSSKLAILGDIHEHQFIAPNAAYAGSLIQQNRAESMRKGCIRWDTISRTGQFIHVPNRFCQLKIDLRNLHSQDEIKQIKQQVSNITVTHVNIVKDENESAEDFEKKKNWVLEEFGAVNSITKVLSGRLNTNNNINQIQSLEEILTSKKLNQDEINTILNMHKGYIVEQKIAKWSIKLLHFDNFLVYGEKNIIDFTSLNGITGIIADNRAGKTSLLDIIVYALYGEILRGDKKTIMNYKANFMYFKLYFEINGEEYYIERYEDRVKNSKITLCKLAEKIQNEQQDNQQQDEQQDEQQQNKTFKIKDDQGTWEIITKESVTETYKFMKQLIGDLDDFKATGLYYDFSDDIIRMKKTQRRDTLSRLFGLTNNTKIISDVKKQIKSIKEKQKSLTVPTEYEPEKKLKQYENEILDINETLKEYSAEMDILDQQITKANILLGQLQNAEKSNEEFKNLNERSAEIKRQIQQLTSEQFPKVEYAKKVELSECDLTEKIKLWREKKHKLQEEDDLRSKLTKLAPYVKHALKRPMNDLATLKQYRAKLILSLGSGRPSEEIYNQLCQYQGILLDEKTKIIKNFHNELRLVSDEYEKINQNTKLGFNESCDKCCNNIIYLNEQLSECYEKKKFLENKIKEVDEKNAKTEKKIKEYELAVSDLDEEFKKSLYNEKIQKSLEETEKKIADYEFYEEYKQKLAEYNQTDIELNEIEKIKQARDDLKNYRDYQNYVKTKNLNMLNDELESISKRLATISGINIDNVDSESKTEQINQIANLEENLAKNKELLKNYQKDNIELHNKIGELKLLQNESKKQIEIKKTYDELNPEYTKELNLLTTYVDCLGAKGMQTSIIKKNVTEMQSKINEILNIVTDFEIEFDVEDTHMDIYILNANTKLNVSMGSGFQKFIISLVFRLVLTSSLNIAPDFIFVDEGFGCMDKKNLSRVSDFMYEISKSALYRFVFIISHLDELQLMLNQPLYINKQTGGNKIQNTSFELKKFNYQGMIGINGKITREKTPKNKTITDQSDVIHCECGSVIKRSSLSGHKKTQKHLKAISS